MLVREIEDQIQPVKYPAQMLTCRGTATFSKALINQLASRFCAPLEIFLAHMVVRLTGHQFEAPLPSRMRMLILRWSELRRGILSAQVVKEAVNPNYSLGMLANLVSLK
jgi:hypothetical protein